MNKKLLYILLLYCLLSCKENTTTTIPFTYNEYGHILIPVKVADTVIDFVFDTGSSLSLLNYGDKPSRLSLTDSCIKVIILQKMKTYTAKISEPVNIKINDVKLKDDIIAVFDSIDNVLRPIMGMNSIKQFFWHFNFADKTVTISKNQLPVPKKSQGLYYTIFNEKSAANIFLRINDSVFWMILDTGYTLNHFEYDEDSTKNIVADTNMILSYMTKDEDNINTFANRLNRSAATKYYGDNYYYIHFDSIRIHQILNEDKSVAIYIMPNLPDFYDKKLFLTLNFFKQFEQMYIDTKEQIIYLKPYEK
jgi:hypothetical protein